MAIQKSESYELDIKSRRLFGRMNAELVDLNRQIENTLTAANAMRLALGAATLTLAEVESVHVTQAHTNDALLFEAQTRLTEMLDAAKANAMQIGNVLTAQVPKVGALAVQAARVATKEIEDDEPMGPIPGMKYVETGYFVQQLHCSTSHVRNLSAKGLIPPPDAVSQEEGGRPKHLWLMHKAAVLVTQLRTKGAAAGAFN
jgi:hypothetical protein